MIKKITLFCFVLIMYNLGFAQNLKIKDFETHFPIKRVAVFNEDKTITAVSDENGVIDVSEFDNNELMFFSHVSYESYEIEKSRLKLLGYKVFLVKRTEHLDEVVISVFKKKEKSTRIAEQFVALSKEDIRSESPQTSADLLASVAGIKVQKSQFGGGSPVLRGMESNRVLLVVDGVRLNNAIYRKGHLQNSITVAPSLLERTEIVFGPSSVIYGSDALGGVIHYYTKTPKIFDKNQVTSYLFSRFSTVNNEISNTVSVELNFKKWASFTSVSHTDFGDLQMGKNRTHGFDDWGKVFYYSENKENYYKEDPTESKDSSIQYNTGYHQTDVLQKFYVPLDDNADLTFNFQYSTSSNIPRFDKLMELKNGSLKFAEWYYGPQQRFLASSQLLIKPNYSWLDKGTFTLAYQNIKESRIQRKFGSLKRAYTNEDVDVYSLNGDFTVPLNHHVNRNLSYGFEVTHNSVLSKPKGEILDVEGNSIVGVAGEYQVQSRFADGGSAYTSCAVYTDYRQDIGTKSTLNTGIRLTNTQLSAKWIDETFFVLPNSDIHLVNTALTATVGYVYKPLEDWQIKGVLSSGFRSPNIDDVGKVREKNGKVTVPNIDLEPEFAYNGELSLIKYFKERTSSFSFNVYYTLLDNYITREALGTKMEYEDEMLDVVTNMNKDKAFITGFTASYLGQINSHWKTLGALTYTKGESYDTKEPLSSIPPIFGRLELIYKKKNFQIGADFRFNAKKDIQDYNISEGIDNYEQTPIVNNQSTDVYEKYYGTPSWKTFGLNGKYIVSQNITIQGVVNNIFDEHYKEFASGVSAAGRNFSLSVAAEF